MTFAPDDPRYGRTAHQLAQLHVVRGELARAESLYQHLREAASGPPGRPSRQNVDARQAGRHLSAPAATSRGHRALQPRPRLSNRRTEAMRKLRRPCRSYPTSTAHRATAPRPIPLRKRAHALSLRARAHALFLQGHYQRAAPLYHSALALQAGDHPDLARTCYYLGRLYDAQDRYRQAEHFYRRPSRVSRQRSRPSRCSTRRPTCPQGRRRPSLMTTGVPL